ncbi:hypothetical protein DPMN_071086 [Dreissena polymorpha]|uniref:Uncharacterized protein n=3 Tax=Dreissena polymorpha TaxID=45954 RepID=A0A9D3Z6U3_DREPO|nr:hypothetical protein DPMN_071086 [Dreissena polymorpha]
MTKHAIMCSLVLMLIILTHARSRRPCPGSEICECLSKNKTTSVFCNGDNIRHTIYFEQLPDDVDKLHLEGFLFTNLSSSNFPPLMHIKQVHFKDNEIVYTHPDLFENWSDLEELSFSDNEVQNTTELFIAIAVVLRQGTQNLQIALQGMRVAQLQDPEFISGNFSKIIALKFSRN